MKSATENAQIEFIHLRRKEIRLSSWTKIGATLVPSLISNVIAPHAG